MEKNSLSHVLKVKDILKVTKGKLITGNEEFECNKFSKDTRKITGGEIYIGLVGETYNGGIFFEKAFENGASGVILENIQINKEQKEKYKDKIIIIVEDTLKALQEIATLKRRIYKEIEVVAITGSVGKTSTKDMIANVLSQKYKTLKTEGNYNNHIGVPLTLLKLEEHEVAVVEMGMNHLGEISKLTAIAKPTICAITNIGTSHIGNLGSRENILKAKLEILEGNEQKQIVINNDNDLLHKFNEEEEEKEKINIITYGIEENSYVYASNIIEKEEESQILCHIGEESFNVKVPVAGRHFIYNALCAASVGNKLGMTNEEIKKGIETFKLTKKRMDIETLENGVKIINDTYNASFESMKGAIQNLSRYQSRKIAVLGDMFELGTYAQELHKKVGTEVAKNNIDILMCAGENAKYIAKQAKEEGMESKNIYYFENKKEIINKIKEIQRKDDIILFKASNGMKFFEIVENLKK